MEYKGMFCAVVGMCVLWYAGKKFCDGEPVLLAGEGRYR